ncbi:MAG: ATP-dependent zinc metalloprotease FtsH [Lentisphaeria bacterium]|nr:ATP-dependent zinc metalloprotease FtsH [Lentisphaeria bacterium]
MNDKKDPPKKALPGSKRKPPASLFLWLLAFLVLASLIVFQSSPYFAATEEWSANEFLAHLEKGEIVSAEVMPESDKILAISGEFKNAPKADAKKADADAKQDDKKDSAPEIVEKDLTKPAESAAAGKKAAPKLKLKYETRIYATDAVISKLEEKGVQTVYLERDVWWKSLLLNLAIAVPILLVFYFIFTRQIHGAGSGAIQFGKSRARMIDPNENHTKFDDVAGCDEAKEEMKEIVEYLRDPLKFKLLGGKIPRGALLTGPPGTGKTLMAKAVSGEASVPFFSISGSDFVEMFVGVGASHVRDMFQQARKNAPCLNFIAEIDAVGRSRFSGIGGGHDEREQTLNALLVEMDGLETQEGVIVIAATNRVDVLDPALLRPGRFDRQIVIDLPDIVGRRKILAVHAKNIKLAKDVDLDAVAKSTPGFSGADLANLINEAALLAARNNKDAATQSDLEEARDKVCFGRERRSRKIPERDRRLTAWHESGHAIVNLFLENSIPLHKVTIIPRGQALGLTMMMEHEDRYSRSRLEMLDIITTDLGGRVAEEIALGDITSGASQDIAHATNLARAMVCSYGMSDKLGTVQYGERADHIYLGRDITRNESCSEQTQREIDDEVKRIIGECKMRATKIITEQRERLDKLANALLERETISGADIRKLLDLPPEEEKAPVLSGEDSGKPADGASAPAEKKDDGGEPPKSGDDIITVKAP